MINDSETTEGIIRQETDNPIADKKINKKRCIYCTKLSGTKAISMRTDGNITTRYGKEIINKLGRADRKFDYCPFCGRKFEEQS